MAAARNAAALRAVVDGGAVDVAADGPDAMGWATFGFDGEAPGGRRVLSLARMENAPGGHVTEILVVVDVASAAAEAIWPWSHSGGDDSPYGPVREGRRAAALLFAGGEDGLPGARVLLEEAFGHLRDAIRERVHAAPVP